MIEEENPTTRPGRDTAKHENLDQKHIESGAARVGQLYGVRGTELSNCISTLGRTWSGYSDPFPTLIDARLNIKSPAIKIEDVVKYAKTSPESEHTSSLSERYTRKIREVVRHLPQVYPVARLTQRPLLNYKYMVSHPTFGADKHIVLFGDKDEVDHKIEVTEALWTLDQSDDMYSALCLYNADFSRTFPLANTIHAGTDVLIDEKFPLECVREFGKYLQEFIKHRLSEANLDGPLSKINEHKGLGFYSFHPDGSKLTDADVYVTPVAALQPRLPNGKPYNDGLLAYHVKNTRLLRMEWQRSERMSEVWDHFINTDYIDDLDGFVKAFEHGGVMVQTDGERRNQVDDFLNRADIDKSISTWRANAYGKDRRISYEIEPLKFTTFRRDDERFERDQRRLCRRDSKSCRARPVKGQPSTTIGPVLNALNHLVFHELEGSAVGFPSYRDEFIAGMQAVASECEADGYEIWWLRSDDENSEQLATLAGERLMEMYTGNLKRVMSNESLSIHPSLFGPLVVPFSLMSGDPFTTWKNVTKGQLTTIRSICYLFGLPYSANTVGSFSKQMFDIFEKKKPTARIEFDWRGSILRWYPRCGTDDQIQPIGVPRGLINDPAIFDRAISQLAKFGTNLSFGKQASGYGCIFDGGSIEINRPAQIGKIEYFELNKKSKSSSLQAFTFYQRLKLLTSTQVDILEKSYRKHWGSDFSVLSGIESWFYNEVIHARGYPISELYNEYSPVDQIAFQDLRRRFEETGDSWYHKDDIGNNLDKLINFILRG